MSVLPDESRLVEACANVLKAHECYAVAHAEYVAWDRRNFMPVPVEEVPEYVEYIRAQKEFSESVRRLRGLVNSLA